MEKTKELLEARKNYLLKIKEKIEKSFVNVPKGSLRISSHGNRTKYYYRTDPKDFNGTYIRENKIQLAQKLAQKDYDKKVLASADQELKAIEKYFSNTPIKSAEQIYETLHQERQKLITPIWLSDDEFVKQWENFEYQGKEFVDGTPELYTSKSERVRSKSEVIIADLLNKEKIPYRYECPIYLKGFGRIYPDFTVLNIKERKEVYWEHLGMMDESTYVEKALQKIALYEQNGIFPGEQLILTYETKKIPLNSKIVRLMIQHYLQ